MASIVVPVAYVASGEAKKAMMPATSSGVPIRPPGIMDQRLDYIFIDEAGQVSLPAAIAVMTSARNVVLLGDPLHLPQVTHTDHPGNVGASVLEHLLGGELRPVAPDRGILLTDSYRMHPDVCSFLRRGR